METELFQGVIDTQYGLFEIQWAGDGFTGEWETIFRGQVNGLVGAAKEGTIYISIARNSGVFTIRIVLLDRPPHAPAEDWEDVVEVSAAIDAPPSCSAFDHWGRYSHSPRTTTGSGSARAVATKPKNTDWTSSSMIRWTPI